MTAVSQIPLIGTPTSNTDLPGTEFPTLERIATTDTVGPPAANRQHAASEKRTLSLRDKVNLLIVNNNVIDETYLDRSGVPQTGGQAGLLGDIPANAHTLTGIRAAAANGEPVRYQEFNAAIGATVAGVELRDWLATPALSRVPVAISMPGTGVTLTDAAIGRWHHLDGVNNDTLVLPNCTGGGFPAYSLLGIKVRATVADLKYFNIIGAGGQLIDGKSTLALFRKNYLILESTGTDWIIKESRLDTEWSVSNSIPLYGTGANPTKGVVERDDIRWRRVNDMIEMRYNFLQGVAGTGGSGDYLVGLPGGFLIDLTREYAIRRDVFWNAIGECQGYGFVANYASMAVLMPRVIANNRIGAWAHQAGVSAAIWGTAYYSFAYNNSNFSMALSLPIVGW
jgi:hypothetical protein